MRKKIKPSKLIHLSCPKCNREYEYVEKAYVKEKKEGISHKCEKCEVILDLVM